MKTLLLVAAMAALSLAGCSRSEPEEVPATNEVVENVAPVEEPTMAPPPPPLNMVETNAAEPLPEAPPEAPDEQMLDDASATGMTARATRDETRDGAERREEEAPAEQR